MNKKLNKKNNEKRIESKIKTLILTGVISMFSISSVYANSYSLLENSVAGLILPKTTYAFSDPFKLFSSGIMPYGVTTETAEVLQNADGTIRTMNCTFQNGDVYSMNRLQFNSGDGENHQVVLNITGDSILVKYTDHNTKQQITTSHLYGVPYETILLSTEKETYLIGVPAVYQNNFLNGTLTRVQDKEQPIAIQKVDGGYNIIMNFPKDPNMISEYWFMESSEILKTDVVAYVVHEVLSYDFVDTMRWSYDGFYYETPHNYEPTGDGVLYNHPANYVGAAWLRDAQSPMALNLAYIMTTVCMANQNNLGFFETGPKSEWLETDFSIGAGFYDTRFNTDFARNLLSAYEKYGEQKFLNSAIKYAEFFLNFAETNHYPTPSGGILVEDYWHIESHEDTHVSLNHHVAEMNFLCEIYEVTKDSRYLEMAGRMLKGVEDTRELWVQDDGNLRYELYYTKNTNPMRDYPYLTYNDLFDSRELFQEQFGYSNFAIEYLMEVKKKWMDNNSVTEYKK